MEPFSRLRMPESQRAGVEHLPARLERRAGKAFRAVDGVADDGVPDRGEMHPDLVRSPRLEAKRDEGRRRHRPEHPVMRHRPDSGLPPARRSAASIARVANEVETDRSGGLRDASFDERHVLALDVVAPEEFLEAVERLAGARENDRAGGFLVEAVDDSHVGALAVPVLEVGVDPRKERVLLVGLRREREEARRLVDDDDVGVFVEDGELRPDVSDRGPVDVERHSRGVRNVAAALAAGRPVDVDAPGLDVVARPPPRERMFAGDALIEPHAAIV